MTIHCKKCGKRINAVNFICPYCSGENSMSSGEMKALRKKYNLHKLIIILAALAAFVLLVVILNANLLLPWQRGARRNRQVILEYAAEHYPDAKIIDEEFNSAKFFVWNNYRDGIAFELDGIEFNIIAEGRNILADGYPRARAEDQLKRMIYDDFLTHRNVNADCAIDFFSGNEPTENIAMFDGIIFINLQINSKYAEPRTVDWLYDFYVFLRDKISPLKYNVSILFFDEKDTNAKNHYVKFSSQSEYSNKSDFYASFS